MTRKVPARDFGKSGGYASSPFTSGRAIYVQGEIDEKLFHALTPQILRLKEDSSDPIAVFIDSPGGSTVHAARLLGLLRAIDHGRERPEIITVATGEACSAAADLLAQGDNVISFRHARLLFHGSRVTSEVTRGAAEFFESALDREDANAARRLAVGVFTRFLSLYVRHAEEVAEFRAASGASLSEYSDVIGKGIVDVPALVGVLCSKIEGGAGEVLNAALSKTLRIRTILGFYEEFAVKMPDSAIFGLIAPRIKGERKKCRMQLRVLEAVIAATLIENDRWDLRATSFRALEADFMQVCTLAEGNWQDELLDLLLQHKSLFFSRKDQVKMDAMGAKMTIEQFDGDKTARRQLDAAVRGAYRRAEPLWQYVSTLCRLLNEGDHEIGPEDAWYMGLIDEVIGYPLAHRRRGRRETDAIRRGLALGDMQKFV